MKKASLFIFLISLFIVVIYSHLNAEMSAETYACKDSSGDTCSHSYFKLPNGNWSCYRAPNKKNKTKEERQQVSSIPSAPAGYAEANDFFIHNIDGTGQGLGVINGVMYKNESDPLAEVFVYLTDNSIEFNSYIDWANAMAAAGKSVGE